MPVSASHPVDAVNLKEARLGLYDQLGELIATHGVEKGRVRLDLASGEQFASLTVNEYETLLMRYDLAEVLKNPLRFAAQKAKHAWDDPRAVPSKTIDYAKYDLVRAVNRLVDALGLAESAIERVLVAGAGRPGVPVPPHEAFGGSAGFRIRRPPAPVASSKAPIRRPSWCSGAAPTKASAIVNVTLTRFV